MPPRIVTVQEMAGILVA
jgi:hypothetical protein